MITDNKYRAFINSATKKETIKSEDSSLRVDCTSEGLRASISCLESNKLEQAKRQGYNSANTSTIISRMVGGIQVTNNNDGSISLKGTAESDFSVAGINLIKAIEITEENSGYYTAQLLGVPENLENGWVNVYYFGNLKNEQVLSHNMLAEQKIQIMFRCNLGAEVDCTIRPFLLKGNYTADTIPDYEQYGAMPSFEIESPIEGVSGDVSLKVQTKNYYDASISEQTSNNITYSADKKILKLNGNLNKENKIIFGAQNLKKGKYALHLRLKNGVISSELKDSILFYIYEENTWTRVTTKGITLNNSKPIGKMVFDFNEEYKIQIGAFIRPKDILEEVEIEYEIVRIEDDTEEFDFVEHQEKNFTISLGNKTLYKGDSIARKDRKWYFANIFTKVNLADFNFFISNSIESRQTNRFVCDYAVDNLDTHTKNCYSNVLASKTASELFSDDVEGIAQSQSQLIVRVPIKIDTVAKLKEELTKLNAYAVVRTNTTYTPIEDEKLIKQLNAIYLHIREYDNITNFDFDNDVKFEITVEKNKISILESRLDKAEKQNTVVEEVEQEVTVENEVIEETVDTVQDEETENSEEGVE